MNKELLNRIEKLEQAIKDIWVSCSCLRKGWGELEEVEPELPEDIDDLLEEPGEHECDRECPDAPCIKCGEYGYREEPDEPEEEEPAEQEDITE